MLVRHSTVSQRHWFRFITVLYYYISTVTALPGMSKASGSSTSGWHCFILICLHVTLNVVHVVDRFPAREVASIVCSPARCCQQPTRRATAHIINLSFEVATHAQKTSQRRYTHFSKHLSLANEHTRYRQTLRNNTYIRQGS